MSIRPVIVWVYDVATMSNVRMTQPGESGSPSSGLTDEQLRASDVKVSLDGEVLHVILDSGPTLTVTGPLTDTQLRATPIPVSGAFYPETQPVSGPLTDTQLRATAVPVSAAALPLPSGAATAASQATLETLIDTLQELVQRLAPLGSVVNYAGGIGLRVVAGQTLGVSGPITSANSIAEKVLGGVLYTQRLAAENLTAHQANIINCTAA